MTICLNNFGAKYFTHLFVKTFCFHCWNRFRRYWQILVFWCMPENCNEYPERIPQCTGEQCFSFYANLKGSEKYLSFYFLCNPNTFCPEFDSRRNRFSPLFEQNIIVFYHCFIKDKSVLKLELWQLQTLLLMWCFRCEFCNFVMIIRY